MLAKYLSVTLLVSPLNEFANTVRRTKNDCEIMYQNDRCQNGKMSAICQQYEIELQRKVIACLDQQVIIFAVWVSGITVPKRENCTLRLKVLVRLVCRNYYFGFMPSIRYTRHLDSGVNLTYFQGLGFDPDFLTYNFPLLAQ